MCRTYSTLVSQAKGSSRLEQVLLLLLLLLLLLSASCRTEQACVQVVKWAGGDEFDGCLVFDECHKSKNFVPGKEAQSTKVGMAGCCVCDSCIGTRPSVGEAPCQLCFPCSEVRAIVQVATLTQELQKQLPKARVLYCSATGVSEVQNPLSVCCCHEDQIKGLQQLQQQEQHQQGGQVSLHASSPAQHLVFSMIKPAYLLGHPARLTQRQSVLAPSCMPAYVQVGNLAYMTRLGLWGPGTAFADFGAFLDSMKKRGVSFLELLAMEMKAEGFYLARSLSFRHVNVQALCSKLLPELAEIWSAADLASQLQHVDAVAAITPAVSTAAQRQVRLSLNKCAHLCDLVCPAGMQSSPSWSAA